MLLAAEATNGAAGATVTIAVFRNVGVCIVILSMRVGLLNHNTYAVQIAHPADVAKRNATEEADIDSTYRI